MFLINVPVTLVGLAVCPALVPQSRAPERPGLDPLGVVSSTAGLASLIYGLIEAGQKGWGNAGAVRPIAAGVAVLAGFFIWGHRLSRRPGGRPLLDLVLLRPPSFTWGAILLALAGVVLVGVIFTLPQYFQGVLGTDALAVGAVLADRVMRLAGAKVTVAVGFALTAAGALVGATTSVGSGFGFVADRRPASAARRAVWCPSPVMVAVCDAAGRGRSARRERAVGTPRGSQSRICAASRSSEAAASDSSLFASPAISVRAVLPTRPSAASGSMKRTLLEPSARPSTTTLHGSSTPMPGSASSARWASRGLQAPRIRYGARSTPSFSFNVTRTSISVRTPNPRSLSSRRVVSSVRSNPSGTSTQNP